MTANVLAAPMVSRIGRDSATALFLKSCTTILREMTCVLQTLSSTSRIKGITQRVVTELSSLVRTISCSAIQHDECTRMTILSCIGPFFLTEVVYSKSSFHKNSIFSSVINNAGKNKVKQ